MKSNLLIASTLQEQRLVGRLCDVTFKVGNGMVSAHRCVLAGASDYFDRLLCSNFKDARKREYDMSGLFSSTLPLRFVIDYIYGVEVELIEDILIEILNASKYFLLDELTEACVSFLNHTLTFNTSLLIWSVAKLYDLEDVYRTSKHVAISRFYDVIKNTEEALCVPPHVLLRLYEDGLAQHCTFKEWGEFLYRWAFAGDTDEHFNIMKKLKSQYHIQYGVTGKRLPRRFMELAKRKQNQESTLGHRHYNQGNNTSCEACKDELEMSSISGEFTYNNLMSPEKLDQRTKIKDDSHNVTEEVIICRSKVGGILYRPLLNKWFQIDEIDRKPSDKYMLYGIGKTDMFIFRKLHGGSLLINIKDWKSVYIQLPKDMHDVQYFCSEGELFCAGVKMQAKMFTIYRYLLHQDSTESCPWSEVCSTFIEHEKTTKKTFLVQDRYGDVHFLIEVSRFVKHSLETGALWYNYNPRNSSLKVIPVPPSRYTDMLYSSPVSGQTTSDGFLYFFDNNKTLEYIESSKGWKIHDLEPLPSVIPGVGQLSRACYMSTFDTEILSSHEKQDDLFYNCLYAYKREDRKLYTIPPPPTTYDDYKISCQLVPSVFLDQLKEKAFESDIDVLFPKPPTPTDPSSGNTLQKGVGLSFRHVLLNMKHSYEERFNCLEDSDDD